MTIEAIKEYLIDTYKFSETISQWNTDTYAQFHWKYVRGLCWVCVHQNLIGFDADNGPDKIFYLFDPECFTKLHKAIYEFVNNSPNHIHLLDHIVDKMGRSIEINIQHENC